MSKNEINQHLRQGEIYTAIAQLVPFARAYRGTRWSKEVIRQAKRYYQCIRAKNRGALSPTEVEQHLSNVREALIDLTEQLHVDDNFVLEQANELPKMPTARVAWGFWLLGGFLLLLAFFYHKHKTGQFVIF